MQRLACGNGWHLLARKCRGDKGLEHFFWFSWNLWYRHCSYSYLIVNQKRGKNDDLTKTYHHDRIAYRHAAARQKRASPRRGRCGACSHVERLCSGDRLPRQWLHLVASFKHIRRRHFAGCGRIGRRSWSRELLQFVGGSESAGSLPPSDRELGLSHRGLLCSS